MNAKEPRLFLCSVEGASVHVIVDDVFIGFNHLFPSLTSSSKPRHRTETHLMPNATWVTVCHIAHNSHSWIVTEIIYFCMYLAQIVICQKEEIKIVFTFLQLKHLLCWCSPLTYDDVHSVIYLVKCRPICWLSY